MHSAAVLALLLCAWQATALPVNSPMNKGDTEVMKCIVEVISDTLSKPSPMPVSQECFETLRGDERILSILRHQNLLKELQDLALQGAKERAQQQEPHSSFEEELSQVLDARSDQTTPPGVTEEAASKDAEAKREDSREAPRSGEAADGAGPQAFPAPGQDSTADANSPAPGEAEATLTQPPPSLPGQKHPGPQAEGDSRDPTWHPGDGARGPSAKPGQQVKREEEGEEEEEEAEAGDKAGPAREGPTAAGGPHANLGHKEERKGKSRSEALAQDGARKTGAEPPEGQEEAEEPAGTPGGPSLDGKGREPEPEEQDEPLSKEWEEAKRWSKMEELAQELTAEKRLQGGDEDEPDRSMKLSFQPRAYGFRGPGPQLRRGWRPSAQEDSVEVGLPPRGHGYLEEKKEEEGSANRRPEDQELESLSAIEAELEKVAQQLQALRRG
ncbi:chromogranin-A isoform X1 [Lepus europaeus]|uniref:chromogranin-A isoform X1 n=1 Tax=Lepus europaeus TaxID=9983 RepID=UPI002B474B7D|nr:chromogranin-A isoform X1 [Lepus europaeus]